MAILEGGHGLRGVRDCLCNDLGSGQDGDVVQFQQRGLKVLKGVATRGADLDLDGGGIIHTADSRQFLKNVSVLYYTARGKAVIVG